MSIESVIVADMQVIYVVFGGLSVVAGLIGLVEGNKIAGVTAIVFGAIVVSLASIVGRIAVLERRLADFEGSVTRAKPEQAAVPQPSAPAGTESGHAPTADDIEAAKALLATAQKHHFAKRFADARELYTQIVDRFGATKQAATARQQIENLRGVG
jgi:hypothetical protein